MVLATLAATIKITAILGPLWLIVAHWWDPDGRPRRRAFGAALDVGVAGLTAAASALAAGFPPTWVHTLTTSTASAVGIAPASVLATAIGIGGLIAGAHGVAGDVTPVCRALALAAGGAIVVTLLARARRGRAGAAAVLGYGGFAIALGGPVLYPWYLATGLPFLAARPGDRATRLVGISSVVLFGTSLSSLVPTWRLLGRHPIVDCGLAVTVLAAAAGAAVAARRTARRPGPDRSAPAEPDCGRAAARSR
jgi:hypothetical protein